MPISNWSTTASSNATADSASGISWPEGMSPAQVNDSARGMMAEIKKWAVNDTTTEYTAFPGNRTEVIPTDNTIPQVTEGLQILSASITPTSTSAKIRIRVRGGFSTITAPATLVGAVFVNGGASAIAAEASTVTSNGIVQTFTLEAQHSPASTSAQTYTVRIGTNNAANPVTPNPQYLGAVNRWTLVLEEVM